MASNTLKYRPGQRFRLLRSLWSFRLGQDVLTPAGYSVEITHIVGELIMPCYSVRCPETRIQWLMGDADLANCAIPCAY